MLKYVRSRPHIIMILAAALFAVSCGETGLNFPILEVDRGVRVLTVASGSVLAPTEEFSVEVVFDGEVVEIDRMVIELLSEGGLREFSVEFGPDNIQLPVPIEIPSDITTGLYRLEVRLYYLEEIIVAATSELYVAAEPHTITGVVSYPGMLYPGGEGLVIASFDVPEDGDPFLRWRSSGEIIDEGYLSDGADMIEIGAPDREGVFSISLELFPLAARLTRAPGEEFLSSNRFEAQLFVSFEQPQEPHELGPADNYSSLFHLRGEIEDVGRDVGAKAEFIGIPSLGIEDGSFGYRFGNGVGISFNRSILPLSGGLSHPFTVSVRLVLEAYGPILTVRGENGAPFARIDVDEDGTPGFAIGNVESRADGAAVALHEAVELTVSVVPEENSVRFIWFVAGLRVSEEVVLVDVIEPPPALYTTIGTDHSLRALFDEIGVYSVANETVDSEVFARAMRLKYGSDLLFADGFDGLTVPEWIYVLPGTEAPQIEAGALIIAPNALVELSPIPIDFESVHVEVLTTSGELAVDAFVDVGSLPSEALVVRYDSEIGYLNIAEELLAPPLESGPIRIDLSLAGGEMFLLADGSTSSLGSIDYGDSSFVVSLGVFGEAPVSIDAILITKNRFAQPEE